MAPISTKKLIIHQRDRANNIARILPATRSVPGNRMTKAMIRDRTEKLCKYWVDFCKSHEEIITRDDIEGDPYLVDSVFAKTEIIRDECNDELERIHLDDPVEGSSRASTEGEAIQTLCHNAHLPKIDLPHFSGRHEDWDAFENRFTSLIHDKPQLTNVVKLEFLLGCLRGQAAAFVKDVKVSDANYLSTWAALQERYSNLRLQIYNLTLVLVKISPLKRESAVGLRSLVDETTHCVRMLRNLGRPVDTWDDLLVVLVSERLDPATRRSWESYLNIRHSQVEAGPHGLLAARKRPPSFKELTEFLEGAIQAMRSVQTDPPSFKDTPPGKRPHPNTFRIPVKVHHIGTRDKSQNTSSSVAASVNQMKCSLCSKEHYIGRCERFRALNGDERRGEINRLGLCFNCMGRHQARNCISKRVCRKCQGSHHSLLHIDRNYARAGTDTTTAEAPTQSDPKLKE